jgi:hypothetical protein
MRLGGEDFAVVTLATGRNPPQAMRRFFRRDRGGDPALHRDINQQIAREMGVFGLPITVILNPEGQEIARLRGDAHWDSPEALALIEALMAGGEGLRGLCPRHGLWPCLPRSIFGQDEGRRVNLDAGQGVSAAPHGDGRW